MLDFLKCSNYEISKSDIPLFNKFMIKLENRTS